MFQTTDRDGSAPLAALVCALLVISLVPAVLVTAPTAASSSSSTERYVVGFYEMPEDREEYKGEPVATVNEDLSFFAVETDEPERFREEARQDDRVRYLEQDRRDAELTYTPNDPRYDDQYAPQQTKTDWAWDNTTGSTAVKVGFLDSGITDGHEDVDDARYDGGYDYVNQQPGAPDTSACGYHGTHVAGIAAATIDNAEGIAGVGNHTIRMHKIFAEDSNGDCGGTWYSDIADALKDLADWGAHVSSNSWHAFESSSTLNEGIDYGHDKGVKHVAAAGNEGPCTDCVSYPWKDRPSKVVIVSCTDSNDDLCSFSSQGPEVDVAAPGYRVLSLDGGGLDGYTRKSGTSMSTPLVGGAIALFIADNGDATHAAIEDKIGQTADDIGLSTEQQGDGRLDTGELVQDTENHIPVASFASSCDDLDCTFDASDSYDPDGTIASYEWELGDGTTDTGEVVDHTYQDGGDYTVTLTVTDDDGGTDQAKDTVSVTPNQPPDARFEAGCHELNCTFDASDSSDSDGTIETYDWEFGDGTTATGQIVDHGYEAEGDYQVNLTVTDDDGATDDTSQTVSVQPNQAPHPDIEATCEEVNCTFDASDSFDEDGTIESYDWEFGDGATATGQTVDHSYDEAGDYQVNLTVTDDDGATNDTSETVSVVYAPTAEFTADCHELNCTFNASGSDDKDGTITSYDWDLGDGSTATGESVDHGYDEAGDYQVNLTVTDDDGATNDTSQTVSVQPNQAPHADFAADCHELNCTFDASDSSDSDGTVETYDWDLGDGNTSTGEVIDHGYGEAGDYTVTLTLTDDDGATNDTSQTVSVQPNQAPHPDIDATCEDVNCTFDASDSFDEDGTVETYEWEFGDGTTATGQIVDHSYDEAGDYQVNLTVTDDDGATNQTSRTVSVARSPTAAIVSTCEYLECTFDAGGSDDSDGTIETYDWEFGDGTTATGEVVDHTYDSGGSYTVNLTVTDDDGASDTTSETVDVVANEPPEAAFTSDCEDLTCQLDGHWSTDEDGEIVSHDWDFGDGTTATGDIVDHTYPEGGEYTVTLTVTDDGGDTDQATATVSVEDPSTTMHVHSIEHEADGIDVEATVTIDDNLALPVGGASVTMEICNVVDVCETATKQTDVFGTASVTWQLGVGGPYETCVIELTHADLAYAPQNDHAREGNCASDTVMPTG